MILIFSSTGTQKYCNSSYCTVIYIYSLILSVLRAAKFQAFLNILTLRPIPPGYFCVPVHLRQKSSEKLVPVIRSTFQRPFGEVRVLLCTRLACYFLSARSSSKSVTHLYLQVTDIYYFTSTLRILRMYRISKSLNKSKSLLVLWYT